MNYPVTAWIRTVSETSILVQDANGDEHALPHWAVPGEWIDAATEGRTVVGTLCADNLPDGPTLTTTGLYLSDCSEGAPLRRWATGGF